MRVILDTNVLVSGIFFGGKPGKVLNLWRNGKIKLMASTQIFEEYSDVIKRLARKYTSTDVQLIIDLLIVELELVTAKPLSRPIAQDRDDDKFFARAVAAKVKIIVSGDADLLDVSGYRGISVLTPSEFLRRCS